MAAGSWLHHAQSLLEMNLDRCLSGPKVSDSLMGFGHLSCMRRYSFRTSLGGSSGSGDPPDGTKKSQHLKAVCWSISSPVNTVPVWSSWPQIHPLYMSGAYKFIMCLMLLVGWDFLVPGCFLSVSSFGKEVEKGKNSKRSFKTAAVWRTIKQAKIKIWQTNKQGVRKVCKIVCVICSLQWKN